MTPFLVRYVGVLGYLGEPLAHYGNGVILAHMLRMLSGLNEACVVNEASMSLVLRMSAYIGQYRKCCGLVQDCQWISWDVSALMPWLTVEWELKLRLWSECLRVQTVATCFFHKVCPGKFICLGSGFFGRGLIWANITFDFVPRLPQC